jgi:2-oxoglutarate dehydrogenase E2 component (dihydrolipoamide succinyltransferase)
MSFFTQACTIALKEFDTVNSMIDGDHMISYNFNDVGIAVSTEKGLMVPVLRNAEEMNLLQIEAKLKN